MHVLITSSSEEISDYKNHPNHNQYPQHHPAYNYPHDQNQDRLERGSSASASDVEEIDYNKIMGELTPINIRHAFVKKTFSLILISLAIAFGICLTVNLVPALRTYFQENILWLSIVACVGMITISMMIMCVPSFANKAPGNLILLFCYSICTGTAIATVGAYSDVLDVLVPCVCTTLIIVASCIAFAFQTKKDFTKDKYQVMAMVALVGLVSVSLIGYFIRLPALSILYGCIGVIIFSCLLVKDVQMIVGGSRTRQFSVDDYTIAALIVHADVINIFLYLMRIFTAMDG